MWCIRGYKGEGGSVWCIRGYKGEGECAVHKRVQRGRASMCSI